MDSFATLSAVQLDRFAAFPEKFADNPFRAVALGALQRRNAALDAIFYDVAAVTEDEIPNLAFWLAREGAILVAPPTGSGLIRVFLSVEEFFAAQEKVGALAVAGVGSSALGAAAFARNVADAIGEPAAAVVSGYGLADVLTEAFGGFFWFGGLNSLRHLFEPLDALTKRLSRTEQTLEAGAAFARTSKDTETLIALLGDERFATDLLVGHSKGNLVISEALYALAAENPLRTARLASQLRIVTFSAKIGMPAPYQNVIDVMGSLDWFGALNSRPDIKADVVVQGAWHSANPSFPLGMGIKVAETLRAALDRFGTRPTAHSNVRLAAALDAPQVLTAALRAAE
ncbi:hypothetical protein [Methylocella sp.]|uniref:hypothetical protein n=1 Tax=Methylocella sp. TaxID=1978226 RepID=UPI00378372BD